MTRWQRLVPPEEISRRIHALQGKIKNCALEGALIIHRADLFYFTGTSQNAFLFIPAHGEPVLMVKKYFPRALEECSIDNVVELRSVKEIPDLIKAHLGYIPKALGVEMDVLPYRELDFYRSLLHGTEFSDISPAILAIRAVKHPWEVNQLQKAAMASSKCFQLAADIAHKVRGAMELVSEIQKLARKLGHGARLRLRHHKDRALPFNSKVLPGPKPGSGKIGIDCMIQIDIKWMFNGYHLDETRLISMGRPPGYLMQAAEALVQLHDLMIGQVKPGISMASLYRHTRAMAQSLGLAESIVGMGFDGYPSVLAPLGHGVGLELYEPPVISQVDETLILPNMILTIKPVLIVKPGLSICIASLIRITRNGNEMISRAPARIIEKL
ncbi:MAG: hypothetical protein DRH12_14995 [Deltaproteobacteria bacterium]|nr:MAG: hypothetical protein DRH12_14995 [Deltaproteobacteria bacterium]